ncbi:hypothetical protein [Streptomyces sp. NPDC056817]|uniref:hypothetical protein n=1 Tax=Streptomyces sp. NPDC056817 TaxID=3345950 RepID=UPI0036BEAE32
MARSAHRSVLDSPGFDPLDSQLIREPERAEPGYWVGCPSVLHEADRGRYLMTYRQRRPRGVELDRGWRCVIAESTDGVTFTDIWSVERSELDSPSMERFSLLRDGDSYLLYLSYVDPADNRWRIDVVSAADPASFDVATRKPVLTAASTSTEGIKDPYTLRVGPAVYLYATIARSREFTPEEAAEAHATADIHNTGLTTQPSALAVSGDGRTFSYLDEVLDTGTGWDRYESRLNCVVPATGGGYLGFYDGSASCQENYEERCGLAVSYDLRTWTKLTPDAPLVTTPHGTGSVRYVDVAPVTTTDSGDGTADDWLVYFELTRADGAHELRVARIPAS